jgi:hypothetical protein
MDWPAATVFRRLTMVVENQDLGYSEASIVNFRGAIWAYSMMRWVL